MDNNNKRFSSSSSVAKRLKTAKTPTTKFDKETFLKSVKKLKLYVEGDRYYEEARAEAMALIGDISEHVSSIEVSPDHESSDKRIYFQLETLEKHRLLVSMDISGFIICDNHARDNDVSHKTADAAETNAPKVDDCSESNPVSRVYETIDALLGDNSPMYRESFARALMIKLQSVR